MDLYLGVFLATGFIPIMAYLLFVCPAVSLGMFPLAVVVSVIIAMATITLLVFLIIPACIASDSLFLAVYTLYVAVSQMKILGSCLLNDPDKRFRGNWIWKRHVTRNRVLRQTFAFGKGKVWWFWDRLWQAAKIFRLKAWRRTFNHLDLYFEKLRISV